MSQGQQYQDENQQYQDQPGAKLQVQYNIEPQVSLERILENKFNEWFNDSSIHLTHLVDVTDFSEINPVVNITPIGENGSQPWLDSDLIEPNYKDVYKNSGLQPLPIQIQPTFQGLIGLRNFFVYVHPSVKQHPKVKEIIYYLEEKFQAMYQAYRMSDEYKNYQLTDMYQAYQMPGKGLLNPAEVCTPRQRKVPNRNQNITLENLRWTSNKRGELIFKDGDLEKLVELKIFRDGRVIRNVIDFNPKRIGKTLEIINAIAEFGFDRVFKIAYNRQWESRNQLLEYLPGNIPPRQLAEVNLEQMLYVPKLTQTETPCPVCKNRNNSQINLQLRSADEPSTTKYVCGNARCRKVWFEEGG